MKNKDYIAGMQVFLYRSRCRSIKSELTMMVVRFWSYCQNSGSEAECRMFPSWSWTSLSSTPVISVCCPVTRAARVGRVSAGNSGLRLASVPWLMRASMAGVGTRLRRLSVRPSVTSRTTLAPLVTGGERTRGRSSELRIMAVILDLQVASLLIEILSHMLDRVGVRE